MNRLFQNYMKLATEANLSSGTKKSKEWFRRIVREELPITNIDKVTRNLQSVKRISPGKLITYEYQAKYADKLPFWDRYPLIFVLEVTKNGWRGLNVHYMHPKHRAALFYDYQKFGQEFIKSDIGKRCVKNYLASQVQRTPKEIPNDLWEIAIQLPYENFSKASNTQVWNSTNRKK